MTPEQITGLIWAGAVVALCVLLGMAFRARKRGSAYRPWMIATIYEWQSQDKRRALEIIEEGRAEARDPEFAEGTVPNDDEAQEEPTLKP